MKGDGKNNFGVGQHDCGMAVIVNVGDKDRAGYYQLRVLGIQNNIPDDDLPWCRQSVNNRAQHQTVGESPTGLLKGSHVLVFHGDPAENAIIISSVDRSGLPKNGQTSDGAVTNDPKYASTAHPVAGNNEEVNGDWNHTVKGYPPDTYDQDEATLLENPGIQS